MFTELVKALALLLTLCFLHGVHIRLWRQKPTAGRITSGLLFGGMTAISIFSPVLEMQGAIFDVRSVVLSMAGLFGGPVVAAIAQERPIPVYFIGVGEKLEDLETFNAREFAQALLG